MFERILQVLNEKNISGYRIEDVSKGLISQASIDKMKRGETKKPRKSTLELLREILCKHFDVSSDWILNGEGEKYIEKNDKLFLEKHGVRFEGVEIIDHFVHNKEEYFERSEYLKLFIKDLVEKGVAKRLDELKEYLKIINPK